MEKNYCAGCEYSSAGNAGKYHTCEDKCKITLFVEGAGEFHCGINLPCAQHSEEIIS